MMIVFDEGLPVGPLTVSVEGGLVVDVSSGAAGEGRPATAEERRAFWAHFWGSGPFAYAFDFRGLTPFQRQILECALKVRPGETATYGELAHMAGRPRAARAAGTAMSKNPFPILFPCHRIVPKGGGVGVYGFGGPETKKTLLDWERGLAPPT